MSTSGGTRVHPRMEEFDDGPTSTAAFSFGRTPSLASSYATADGQPPSALQPAQVFPSRPRQPAPGPSNFTPANQQPVAAAARPILRSVASTDGASSVSSFVTDASGQQQRGIIGYNPPPGLASTASLAESLRVKPAKPRGARVDYKPPLPAEAQWLLMTTPPPPPGASRALDRPIESQFANQLVLDQQRHASSAGRRPDAAGPEAATAATTGSVSKRKLLAAALGFKPAHSVLPPPVRETRVEPPRVQLQLGSGAGRARSSNDYLNDPRSLRGVLRSHGSRLDSRSPAFELPRTWEEYLAFYAKGAMDIEDPPFPPIGQKTDAFARPSPYQEGLLHAPIAPTESIRRRMLQRLNLLGDVPGADAAAGSAPMAVLPSNASSRTTMSSYAQESMFAGGLRRESVASTAPSSSSPSPGMAFPTKFGPGQATVAVTRSFADQPALQAIVDRSRQLFGARMTLISLMDEQRQILLAADGLPDQIDKLPRAGTMCAHTLLNGERGLVILDTQRDWRFTNNVLSIVLNARFYAGMPIFGPPDPELEEEAGGRIAIGTVAIVDDQPRANFTSAERAKLRALATDVSAEIAAFVAVRRGSVSSQSSASHMAASHASMPPQSHRPRHRSNGSTSSYIDWQTNTHAAAGDRLAKQALPPTPPGSVHRRPSHATDDVLHISVAASSLSPPAQIVPSAERRRGHRRNASDASSAYASDSQSVRPTFPSASARPLPRARQQKVFDAATSALGNGLKLSLVYLVSLDLSTEPGAAGDGAAGVVELTLLSAFKLPSTTPSFDASLHLKALRAPEGGLLFKNPLAGANDCSDKGQTSSPAAQDGGGYASGILLPVAESKRQRMGWVLAGYTTDTERQLDEDELNAFLSVVEQLRKILMPGEFEEQ